MAQKENPRCRIVFTDKAGKVIRVMDPRTGEDIIPASQRKPEDTAEKEKAPDPIDFDAGRLSL
jgi:hypothetical protein